MWIMSTRLGAILEALLRLISPTRHEACYIAA